MKTSALVAFALVLLAVAAGVVVDRLVPVAERAPAPVTAAQAPVSGAWYCAVGDTAAGNALFVAAAVPPEGATGTAVRVDTFGEGAIQRGAEAEVFPGTMEVSGAAGDREEVGVAARWWRAPAAVSRVWIRGEPGEPGGIVEGPCEPKASTTWFLPGVTTVGGAQARIVLANPFDTDAAVGIELTTPDGPESPELLKNIGVPSHGVRVIDLNQHAPELADLGAIVRSRTGRVVAEAWQSLDAAVGNVEGISLAKLTDAPADTWTIPWFQGPGATSWLWVTNADERPATLALTVHTPAGGAPPTGVEEVTVPGGTTRRIDLRGVLPEGVGGGAVTVTSANGIPVSVSGASTIEGSSPERSGIAVQLGARLADALWLISTAPNVGRGEVLHLVNPTAEPAVVDVRVISPSTSRAPDELQDVTVPPGAAVDLDVGAAVPDQDQHTIVVDADGGQVVAGIHAFSLDGPLRLVARSGIPSGVWAGGQPVPAVEFVPGLPQRLGTAVGPATTPEPTPSSAPSPLPSVTPPPFAPDVTEAPSVAPTGGG